MATNWIKWTVGLGRKPEVLDIAALLSIHRLHAAGLCAELWEWTDANATVLEQEGGRPGFVRTLSATEATFDAIFGLSGFAAALIRVKWLQLRTNMFWFPNLGRHNGEPAKKRALDAERKAKHRSGASVECPPTKRTKSGPEKRREERDTSNDVSGREPHTRDGPKKKPKVPFVKPTIDEVRAYITAQRYQVDPQRFCDHYESNGWRVGRNAMQDWRAAVRNWHRTPLDGQASHPTPKPKPEYPTLKPITGMTDD
jgi:hypothetical protein